MEKSNEFMVDSPTKVLLSKNKKTGKQKYFELNINAYRNLHWSMLNKSKQLYKDIMTHLLMKSDSHLLRMDSIEITYQVIACNKRKFDVMNVVAIVDKYFQDVLSTIGIIADDNYKIVKKVTVLPVIHDLELPENICRIVVKEYNN